MSKTKFTLILIAVITVSIFTLNTVYAQEPLQENQNPVIDTFLYTPHLVQPMAPVTATITYRDPDPDDSHIITFDWGDGETESGTEASKIHLYKEAGIYRLYVTVEDNAGGSITMRHNSKIIVYDTLAGFTTGGGWITCPHDVTGEPARGYFGFNAKYHKNGVKGNVVFHIKDGLRFKSTEIRWLVITGENRVIYGVGVLDDETECLFTVKVRDSGKDDGFDIFLQNADTKEIIYDSYVSTDATYYTVIPLNGGNIATHNPQKNGKNVNAQSGVTKQSQVNSEAQIEVTETGTTNETPTPKENNGKAYGKIKNQSSNKSKKPTPKNNP